MKYFKDFFMTDLLNFTLDDDVISVINEIVLDYFPHDMSDLQKTHSLTVNKNAVLFYLVTNTQNKISFDVAQTVLNDSDSFGRPKILYALSSIVDKHDWLKLFKSNWHMSDSCSLYHEEFRDIFSRYSIDEIRNIVHDEDDIEFYESLPDTFVVYRGTFVDEDFACGISWTTNEEVAEKFKFGYENFAAKGGLYFRYLMNIDSDTLDRMNEIAESGVTVLQKTVNKKDIFVTTSRGESEVIVLD